MTTILAAQIVARERETLRALEQALDSDDARAIQTAVQAALDAMPQSVLQGELGAVFKALGRYARRQRIRSDREPARWTRAAIVAAMDVADGDLDRALAALEAGAVR